MKQLVGMPNTKKSKKPNKNHPTNAGPQTGPDEVPQDGEQGCGGEDVLPGVVEACSLVQKYCIVKSSFFDDFPFCCAVLL